MSNTFDKNSEQYKAFILWADKFNFGDKWIDEHCTFNINGTVDVKGSIDLGDYRYAYLPDELRSVTGDLNLGSLTSADGLTLPSSIGGDLNLWSLTSAEGLKFPDTIGGDLYLWNLTSAK